MTTDRPGLYPYHDVNATNVIWPEDSDFLYSGYVANVTPVPSADHNGKLHRAGFWHAYLDQNGIRNEDWFDTAVAAQLSLTSLTYNSGGNVLTTGAAVNARGTYLINATRIETDAAFLNPVGGSVLGDPLVYTGATVPGRIWVYANANGQVRYESAAPAAADVPGVNEISLIGLDINALGVVTNGAVVPVTLPLPDRRLPVTMPLYLDGTGTMLSVIAGDAPGGDPGVLFDGQSGTALLAQANSVDPVAVFSQSGAGTALTAQGSVSITVDLTVDGSTTMVGTATAEGDANLGTGAGNTVITVGSDALDTMNVTAASVFNSDATFLSQVDMVDLDAIGNVNLGTGVGNKTVTIGTAAADTLDINATVDFGANTITGAGGTITTSTVNASLVAPTEIHYNTGVGAAPSGNGETGYDGRSLTIGDGSAARQYHTPTREYVVSDSTVAAVEDITGASITMDIDDDEWVFFNIKVVHELNNGASLSLLLAATNGVDSVAVLNSGDPDTASYGFTFGATQRIAQTLTVRWKPTNDVVAPDNTTWTIYARHGVTGGNTLTTSNVELQGWYEPT